MTMQMLLARTFDVPWRFLRVSSSHPIGSTEGAEVFGSGSDQRDGLVGDIDIAKIILTKSSP